MKKVAILLIVVMLSEVEASKGQSPYVAIPDSNFVHYLKTIVPTAFKGDSLNTSSTAVTTFTNALYANGLSISNLFGVQYFTSLTTLYCFNNSLTSLPALPNSLKDLLCQNNSLTNLPTLPNSLGDIDCNTNHLTSLPVLPNSLKSLRCQANSLTTLPTLPDSLIDLYCDLNYLTTLPALPNSLRNLTCSSNYITCFPTFPDSILLPYINYPYGTQYYIFIDPNPYTCLPNHIAAMDSTDLAKPLCAAGNSNGCAVAGIEQYANSNAVSIYPNPANQLVNLKISGAPSGSFDNAKINSIEIYNTIGECVHRQIIKSSNFQISVSDLAEGVYNIIISSNEGVVNKRLVIVR